MRSYAFKGFPLPFPLDVEAEFTRREILAEVKICNGELLVEADAPLIVVHEIARMFRCRVGRGAPQWIQSLGRAPSVRRSP